MFLIVGLGNPGKEFENTPHNVGFKAVEMFAEKNNFPAFVLQKKSNALVSESLIGEDKIMLVKPQTFMNESGKSVLNFAKTYKLQATSFIVVHDDVDLPLGKIKIVKERGSAGHKGVESIIKAIGNDGLTRIRIGIDASQTHGTVRGSVVASAPKAREVVLKKFSTEEQKIANQAIKQASEAIELLIKEGLEAAMNQFN